MALACQLNIINKRMQLVSRKQSSCLGISSCSQACRLTSSWTMLRGTTAATKSAHLRKDGRCYLCALVGQAVTGMKMATSKLGCFQCGHCYHLHCFNLFHHHHINMNEFNAWLDLAVISSKLRKRRFLCLSQWEVPSQQVVPVT